MTAWRRHSLKQIFWFLVIIQAAAFVGMVTAEVRPASGIRTHYGFQARGPLFMDSVFAHLIVDVDLRPFGSVVEQAEAMVDAMMAMAVSTMPSSDVLEIVGALGGRIKWINDTYTELRMYYTSIPEDGVDEVRVKRFIFAALLAGAIGGLMGGGLYGYATGGQVDQFREDLNSLAYRLDKLIHVAEIQDKSIHVMDKDVERLKAMANRMADAIRQNNIDIGFMEMATKTELVLSAATERLSVVRMVAGLASAGKVSHELMPYGSVKAELDKLQRVVSQQNRRLVTTDVKKILQMEATLLPAKNDQFAVMIHVPTFREDQVLNVWKYESYSMYDEKNHLNLRVKGENGYLAVTQDEKLYVELTAEALAACHVIGKWRLCPDVRQLRDDYNASCLMSLFLGRQADAMKICQLHVEAVTVNVDAIGGNHFRVSTSRAEENQRVHFVCDNGSMPSVQLVAETYVQLRPGCFGVAGPVRFYSETPEMTVTGRQNLHWQWTVHLGNHTMFSSAIAARKELNLREEWVDRVLPSSAEVLASLRVVPHWAVYPSFVMSSTGLVVVIGVILAAGYLYYRPNAQQQQQH